MEPIQLAVHVIVNPEEPIEKALRRSQIATARAFLGYFRCALPPNETKVDHAATLESLGGIAPTAERIEQMRKDSESRLAAERDRFESLRKCAERFQQFLNSEEDRLDLEAIQQAQAAGGDYAALGDVAAEQGVALTGESADDSE